MNWVIRMKLKALLVDDEYPILQNLSKVLKWEDLGIEIAGMARNGIEALKIAEDQPIDILLSDIRMPVMDGLTLAKEIRGRGMKTEILLLTGYQEFEYARTALRYGVKDYISKPIHYELLEQTVAKIAAQIRSERGDNRLGSVMNSVMNWASEHFMAQMLSGHHPAGEKEEGDEDEELLSLQRYSVLFADLEGYAGSSVLWSQEQRKRFNSRMKRKLKEQLPASAGAAVLQLREGEWFIFYDAEQQLDQHQLYLAYEGLQQMAGLSGDMQIRFIQDKGPFALKELSSVYNRLQRALLLASSEAEEWLISGEALEAVLHEALDRGEEFWWRWLERMGAAIRNEEEQALRKGLEELRACLDRLDEYEFNESKLNESKVNESKLNESKMPGAGQLLHNMLVHLLREMRELHLLKEQEEAEIWRELGRQPGLKDLMNLLAGLAARPKGPAASRKSAEQLMREAGNYIAKHLGEDFGIEEAADYLGISCSYFCLLFKNHYGETFVEYVTRQRMESAKQLLAASDRSITLIGQGLGYQERRYFSKVFQKYAGLTPSEYRATVHGAHHGKLKE
ncbi:response regulator [Paenibacillus pinistramenti]|uniref:response regulator n=1 Tax=Paenibacillus pinistramenti TaxID=1768003 RepID=UPI0013968EDA|nr:response regulator [Paenibacillus pinistramenti]